MEVPRRRTGSTACCTTCARNGASAPRRWARCSISRRDVEAAGAAARQLMFIEKIEHDASEAIDRLESVGESPAPTRSSAAKSEHRPPKNTRRIIMALLQISEPGMSPAAPAPPRPSGIDLGTTNSLVGCRAHNSIPEVLSDEARPSRCCPRSCAYLPDRTAHIGFARRTKPCATPKNTIVSKSSGSWSRDLRDVANIEHSPYDFVDAPGMVQIKTAAGVKSPLR